MYQEPSFFLIIYGFCFHCYTENMQKIATRVFIYSSIAFGIIGIFLVLSNAGDNSEPNKTLMKLILMTVFIILPSFALSIAGKYLNGKF